MNSKSSLILWLLALVCHVQAHAQEGRFFRISGPAASRSIAFRPDGSLVWSNAQAGLTYTIQTASSLSAGPNWVDYLQLAVTQAINTNLLVAFHPPAGMTLIPAGTFTMGNLIQSGNTITNDPDISDANPTNVYVSGVYMDMNLVSSNQWATVYAYAMNQGYSFDNAGSGKATNQPVQTVDWYDAVKWCNARSQQAGLTPVYYTDAQMTQVYANGDTDALYVNWLADGYRLPTEAEWEKAARGGLIGQRFPWGDTISESRANYDSYWVSGVPLSWYDVNTYSGYNTNFDTGSVPYTSPVGYFSPNGYELYDMAGNVQEWCWDWYGTPYGQPTTTNPTGPVSGSSRVLRGGNWYIFASVLRCADRSSVAPSSTDYGTGFRCVRAL